MLLQESCYFSFFECAGRNIADKILENFFRHIDFYSIDRQESQSAYSSGSFPLEETSSVYKSP